MFIFQDRFVAQPDFAVSTDFQNFDFDFITFPDNIGYFGHPAVGKLGNVNQTVRAR
jgi:hypothetical protein